MRVKFFLVVLDLLFLLSGNGHRGAGYSPPCGPGVLHGATTLAVRHGKGRPHASAVRGGVGSTVFLFVCSFVRLFVSLLKFLTEK